MIFNNVLGKKAAKLQSKSVTYTSNGTASVTPDSGYDGLSSVNVTVDVSGSTGAEKCTIILTHNGYGSKPITYVYRQVSGTNIYNMSGILTKGGTITLSNVACNSLFAAVGDNNDIFDVSTNITEDGSNYYNDVTASIMYATTPKTSGATGTITVFSE